MSIITICTETNRGFYTKKCDHKNVITKNAILKCDRKMRSQKLRSQKSVIKCIFGVHVISSCAFATDTASW